MNQYDPAKAARVWQRVRASAPAEPPAQEGRSTPLPLGVLIAGEKRAWEVYGRLGRQAHGEKARSFQQLQRSTRQQADCLAGLLRLEGAVRIPAASPMGQGQPEALLRLCYRETGQRWEEMKARCGDPEFGPVFKLLAAREAGILLALLEALGMP